MRAGVTNFRIDLCNAEEALLLAVIAPSLGTFATCGRTPREVALRGYETALASLTLPGGPLDALFEPVRQLGDDPCLETAHTARGALRRASDLVHEAIDAWTHLLGGHPCRNLAHGGAWPSLDALPARPKTTAAPSFRAQVQELMACATAILEQALRCVREVIAAARRGAEANLDANDVKAYLKGLASVVEAARLVVERFAAHR